MYIKYFNNRVKCEQPLDDTKHSIGLSQYKGVYAYLGLGIIAAIIVLFVEQVLYRYTIPFIRSRDIKSNWKSYKLMFFSQVIFNYKCFYNQFEDLNIINRDFIELFIRLNYMMLYIQLKNSLMCLNEVISKQYFKKASELV